MRPLWCLTYYSLVQHSIVKFFYSLNIFLNSMTGKNDKGLLASVKSSSYRAGETVEVVVGGVPTALCWEGLPLGHFPENTCIGGSKIENCPANCWDDSRGTAILGLGQIIVTKVWSCLYQIWVAFDCKPTSQRTCFIQTFQWKQAHKTWMKSTKDNLQDFPKT